MAQGRITSSWSGYRGKVVWAGMLFAAVLLGLVATHHPAASGAELAGLPLTNQTINQTVAVVVTVIALVVPLSANLYTPTLVKHYVAHPLVVGGLSVFFLAHLLVLSLQFVQPRGTPAKLVLQALYFLYLVIVVGVLPYLYGISRFLRPSYFMPMLTRKGLRSLQELERGRRVEANKDNLFENIDVVTNVALTGMARGDRQLVLLALRALHTLLTGIIGSGREVSAWRLSRPWFVPGLAKEGQDYLIRERVWPEAYVLAQTLKVAEMATRKLHELLSELAGQLVGTARLACAAGSDPVIELHVMTFNTLFHEALDERDLRRFQNLSYHYRLLIEAFHHTPERMHDATRHLMHYAHQAAHQGLTFAFETVIYDLGELVLSIGHQDEARAVELIQAWAGPVWQEAITLDSGVKKVGWRTLLRTHWEARARGLKEVADAIFWRFLTDEAIHRDQLELLLGETRELHYEFNDRLMRFAHLSQAAEAEAQAFLEQW